jgi:CubicO group peptidase (beta-lactamase class C family)
MSLMQFRQKAVRRVVDTRLLKTYSSFTSRSEASCCSTASTPELATKGKVDAPRSIGRYAYGFGDKVFDGKHIVGRNGGWPGVAANFEMYPELGYTSVILMNSDPPTMMPVNMQLRKLIPAN